ALFVVLFFVGHAGYWMMVRRPAHLTQAILGDLRQRYLTVERLVPAAVVIAALTLFTSVFTSMKVLIPAVQPFRWDAAFADWDRILHFGVDPWRLTHAVFGADLATSGVNALYNLWFFVLFLTVFWQAFAATDRVGRMRFFVSFVLCWAVIGNLAATFLSSAGPVYFDRVTELTGSFGELMAALEATAETNRVWALEVQEMLWAGYSNAEVGLGGGISAMPSLHVAMAVLFVFIAARRNRLLAWGFGIYAAAIMIGSVHLAWHYAIDGYLGALMAWGIWWLSGYLVRDGRT
ncbi:MAG: phosphatase PAP2 family protein, partial [Alphaproteobacteria bacterium]|nr:phosphatase PAP2 family protein [Alphaproteobacteria bacterium]